MPATPILEAVVLAAGRSRRAGTFKPAVQVDGRALLRHAVDGLLPWCRGIVVVTGHEPAQVHGIIAGLDRVATVHNPDFAGDMFLSVRTGAAAVAPDAEGFFVLPVDCPFVGAAVYEALLEAFAAAGRTRAVVPVHGGRGGHPVLLPAAARSAILAAPASATLRGVVAALQPLRLPVASPTVLADLDTPGDLARLRRGSP